MEVITERRMAPGGQAILIVWGERQTNAELLANNFRFDGVYQGRRDGVTYWFRLFDPQTCHSTAERAINAAIADRFGTPIQSLF